MVGQWLDGVLLICRESLIFMYLGLMWKVQGFVTGFVPVGQRLCVRKFPCRAGETSHFVMVKKTKSLLCRGGQGRGKQLTGA